MTSFFPVFSPLVLGALTLVLLSGCTLTLPRLFKQREAAPVCVGNNCPTAEVAGPDTPRPQPRPLVEGTDAGSRPGARGFVEGIAPDKLDKTTEVEKAAATTGPVGGEVRLGRTIASLGDVTRQGFWLKTPLVDKEAEGRIVLADTGNSVKVKLIPKGGDKGAGSQISLAAMRALEIPLTTLPELIVFAAK